MSKHTEIKLPEGDEQLWNNVQLIHAAFVKNAEEYRIKAKLPKESLPSILEDLAQRSFVINYKGYYVLPDLIVPPKIKEVIDKFKKD